jgi:hypothetical protein
VITCIIITLSNMEATEHVLEEGNEETEVALTGFQEVVAMVRAVNAGDSSNLIALRDAVDDCLVDLEEAYDDIMNTVEGMWAEVVEPFVEHDGCLILGRDPVRVKQGFREWLLDSTETGRQMAYLYDLRDAIGAQLAREFPT